MEKIPTAEEFAENYTWTCCPEKNQVLEAMLGFAKLHVEAALKKASEKTYKASTGNNNVYHTENAKDSIINAYPLNNIK